MLVVVVGVLIARAVARPIQRAAETMNAISRLDLTTPLPSRPSALAEIQTLCPDTQLVSVGDRESDLYELFAEAARHPMGPKLLVRAERSRNRRVPPDGGGWRPARLLFTNLQINTVSRCALRFR